MTKLAPEWVRTSDPVIRSPARYRWTTAPARFGSKCWYQHPTCTEYILGRCTYGRKCWYCHPEDSTREGNNSIMQNDKRKRDQITRTKGNRKQVIGNKNNKDDVAKLKSNKQRKRKPKETAVKIIYSNAQGMKSKRASILQIIDEIKPTIIAFTETRLTNKERVVYPGYR